MPIPDSSPLSMRAYAKRRGVSHVAVQRAVRGGRLDKSLARDPDGRVLGIGDPDLADQEWAANTDLSKAPAYVKERADADDEDDAPEMSGEPSLAEASQREKAWKAKLAELKFRREAGELVPAAEVRGKLADVFAACRTHLLAVPSRAKQAMPHLSPADVETLSDLVREALEELGTGAVDGA